MAANNDALPFILSETVVPSGAASVSEGAEVQHQATRMGLVLVAELAGADPLDGTYTIIVETADESDLAANTWSENALDSVSFDDVGTFQIQLTQPVFDKVRILIETDASNPEYLSLTAHWLCDTALTAN